MRVFHILFSETLFCFPSKKKFLENMWMGYISVIYLVITYIVGTTLRAFHRERHTIKALWEKVEREKEHARGVNEPN